MLRQCDPVTGLERSRGEEGGGGLDKFLAPKGGY